MDRHLLLIIPPEYFPTLETAACMLRADKVVLLDTAQYSRQSFQNRTRIRNPNGFQWLTIPISGGQFGESIADTRIDDSSGWRRQHDKALRFNYSTSPYFVHYRPKLEAIFDSDSERLGDITSMSMQIAVKLLGCDTIVERASNIEGRPEGVDQVLAMHPESICMAHESLPTGPLTRSPSSAPDSSSASRSTGDVSEQAHPGGPVICSFDETPWRQNFDGFVSGMGSLDLLFNLGPGARDHLLANSCLTL